MNRLASRASYGARFPALERRRRDARLATLASLARLALFAGAATWLALAIADSLLQSSQVISQVLK